MDDTLNPYSPGAGRRPVALVGRDEQLDEWLVNIKRVELERDARPMALYGLRGVGKTVLLRDFYRTAEERDWIVAMIEVKASRPFAAELIEELYPALQELAAEKRTKRVMRALRSALSLKATVDHTGTWTFGIDLGKTPVEGSGSLTVDLSTFLKNLSRAAAEQGKGVALLIDEAQDLSNDELEAICATAHLAGQEQWPFLLALAGLPGLPAALAEAKSYAERLFKFHHINQLNDDEARRVIVDPAAENDVEWHPDGVNRIVDATHGYPYFLQEYGDQTWKNAARSPITDDDARVGCQGGLRALDTGFFRARWDRATPKEKEYLRAMAIDGSVPSASGAVAKRLDRKGSSLGPARASLIRKGLIYQPEHGQIAFTVPLMHEFIGRQPT